MDVRRRGEMNERVTSISIIARNFVFKSKCMSVGRAPPGPAERAEALPRPHFRTTKSPKRFGGRALPGPAGELKRSPRSLAAVRDMEGNTLWPLLKALCIEEGVEGWKYVECAEMKAKGYF